MGSCHSSESEGGPGPRPYRGKGQTERPPVSLPQVEWKADESWAATMTAMWKTAVETNTQEEFCDVYPPLLVSQVYNWVEEMYPECAKAGTIENMGRLVYPPGFTPYPHTTRFSLVIDNDYAGLVYAAVAILAPPLKNTEGNEPVWMKPGYSLGTNDLEEAKTAVLHLLRDLRRRNINLNHAWVHIFIGVDKYSCKFDDTTTEPTIIDRSEEPDEVVKEFSRVLALGANDLPEELRRKSQPNFLKLEVQRLSEEYPGATVWDEGECPFSVHGTPYPFPVRLLVVRHFSKMVQDADAQTFTLSTSKDDPDEAPVKLLRNTNQGNDPGGIVSIALVVTVDTNGPWVDYGKYISTAAFKVAEKMLLEHVKKLHKAGKTERCTVRINMGFDHRWYKFVGDKVAEPLPLTVSGPTDGKGNAEGYQWYRSLEPYGVTLKELPKHDLWQSESQFQAIKKQMLERAEQNPEVYKTIARKAALETALSILRLNFPGCEISDEGEFPVATPESAKPAIEGARLVVVRDTKQAPASIVAAQHVVSLPRPGLGFAEIMQAKWLGTEEVKAAEAALLQVLRQWHAEGKVSTTDCMALVSMGQDATLYQFVEGERFVDLTDERMERFRWG